MEGSRKRAKIGGGDKSGGAPSSQNKSGDDVDAATKVAELRAKMETMRVNHELEVNELKAQCKLEVDELRLEVDALKSKNDSHLGENKGLKSALRWAYTTERRIPRQHWLQKECSEEYADDIENLLSSIKQIIQDLWLGSVSESISIDFDHQDEDWNYIKADHDELLLPYWEEFAAALTHWSEHYADYKILEVSLRDIELPKVVFDILRPAFEESRIKDVLFEGSGHPGDMADFINKVLRTNHFITNVCFGTIMFDQEDVKTICSAIKARNAGGPFVERLEMTDCFVDGIESQTLQMILASVAAARSEEVSLHLNDNGMSSREAVIMAEFLSSNPTLTQLNVSNNRFDDADAVVLANALSNNTSLRGLQVRNNEIKANGRFALLRVIFDVSSLDSCATSNHICRVHGLEQDISALNSATMVLWNKWEKIFAVLALSSEDSFINTSLLDGVPAQLIPKILNEAHYADIEDDDPQLTDLY